MRAIAYAMALGVVRGLPVGQSDTQTIGELNNRTIGELENRTIGQPLFYLVIVFG